MKRLKDICKEKSIPEGMLDYAALEPRRISHDEIYVAVNNVSEACRGGSMLIRGQTASPCFSGHRSRRVPSTDLDFFINLEGIDSLTNSKYSGELFFNKSHGDLVFFYEGMPVSFHLESIHDLDIGDDFWRSGISFDDVSVIAPEYTVAMKLRRALSKGRLFGKDRVDISTLMIAPYFKDGLREFDFSEMGTLVSKYISGDVSGYICEIEKEAINLRKNERVVFGEVLASLSSVCLGN